MPPVPVKVWDGMFLCSECYVFFQMICSARQNCCLFSLSFNPSLMDVIFQATSSSLTALQFKLNLWEFSGCPFFFFERNLSPRSWGTGLFLLPLNAHYPIQISVFPPLFTGFFWEPCILICSLAVLSRCHSTPGSLHPDPGVLQSMNSGRMALLPSLDHQTLMVLPQFLHVPDLTEDTSALWFSCRDGVRNSDRSWHLRFYIQI